MKHYSRVTSRSSCDRIKAAMACVLFTAMCLSGLNPIDEPVKSVAYASESVHVADLAVSADNNSVNVANENLANNTDDVNKTFEGTNDADTLVDELNESETEAYNEELVAEAKNADAMILQKYAYALYDDVGARNDLTPDLLRLTERCCLQQGIEPNLFLGIVMAESRGKASAKNKRSTATGFGQLLKSTGKWAYEDLLGFGKGTYNHNLAYNPELNIMMSTAVLGELRREYNGNMYKAVRHYRGTDITGYLKEINRWLSKSGLSVYNYV